MLSPGPGQSHAQYSTSGPKCNHQLFLNNFFARPAARADCTDDTPSMTLSMMDESECDVKKTGGPRVDLLVCVKMTTRRST